MSRQRRPEVQAVVDERVARLQRACDAAHVKRLMRAGGAKPGKAPGEHRVEGGLPAFSKNFEASIGRTYLGALELDALVYLKSRIIPTLVRSIPSVTREQLVGLIAECWPPARGPKAEPLFAARELRAALRALTQDGTSYARAVDRLADELRADRRTIERTLARARRK